MGRDVEEMTMNKLAIDTSTDILSVAIMKENNVVAETMTKVKKDHSSKLMPTVVQLMDEVQLTPEQVQKVIVGNGPGSYTGTRIGVTMAKTFAWSLNIPIYTESSLRNLAKNVCTEDVLICPFFDARRQNVFAGLYERRSGTLETVQEDRHLALDLLLRELNEQHKHVIFLSPHIIESVRASIEHSLGNKAQFVEPVFHNPRASHMLYVDREKEPSPVHLVAPNYIRLTEAEANLLQKKKDE